MIEAQCSLFVAGILVSFVFILQPIVVLGDIVPIEASSYIFTSIDIALSRGQFGFTSFGFTSLDDINDRGEIVGGDTRLPGFLLDEKTQFTDIECPGARDSTAAKSINKRGEIAGFCFAGRENHGFFRDKKGKYTLLDFPGATLTQSLRMIDTRSWK